MISDAAKAFSALVNHFDVPLRFISEEKPWWGQVRPFKLTPDRILWIVVMVPESDLIAGISQIRTEIMIVTAVVLLLALVMAGKLAHHYSKPIEALVQQSDRISRGDFNITEVVTTRVAEVQKLAKAHDRMREGLQSLMKLEDDLQIARQIQQGTFPQKLPDVIGYEIETWSEPADETGGDTYDVIGNESDPTSSLAPDQSDRAMFLLADATGHGIGPALSATSIRAMFRMLVRMRGELPDII